MGSNSLEVRLGKEIGYTKGSNDAKGLIALGIILMIIGLALFFSSFSSSSNSSQSNVSSGGASKFCGNCGKVTKPSDRFCVICGYRFEAVKYEKAVEEDEEEDIDE